MAFILFNAVIGQLQTCAPKIYGSKADSFTLQSTRSRIQRAPGNFWRSADSAKPLISDHNSDIEHPARTPMRELGMLGSGSELCVRS
jgi:hypothetical protein